jgi:hypothetical protein
MKDLIRDTRVQRLLLANVTGSIGAGITIVAIPWLLDHRSGGDQIYGYATIGTTIALFRLCLITLAGFSLKDTLQPKREAIIKPIPKLPYLLSSPYI